MAKFFGKYRGKVESNEDPLQIGRLQVSVPAVLGEGAQAWALPNAVYAGDAVGLYLKPPVGANVWVEFEAGDTRTPIWTGCFWTEGENPADPPEPTTRALIADGVSLIVEDKSGGSLTLEVGSPIATTPVTLTIDSSGLVIETGSSKLELSATGVTIKGTQVSVN